MLKNKLLKKSKLKKENKVRIIMKENLVRMINFLLPCEKLHLILTSSFFSEIVRTEKLYSILKSIKNEMSQEHHKFPLQLLLKKDSVLIETILIKFKLRNLPMTVDLIKFLGKFINYNYFQVPYYNE